MKRMMCIILLGLVFILPITHPTLGSGWEIIPAIHRVNGLIRVDDFLWGATNSGLFRYDLESETFVVFTTADGLSSMEIDAIAADNRGNLILGMGNAYVDIFNLMTYEVTHLSDFHGKVFEINALHHHDGEIFVGTDVGVSRMVFFEELGEYLIGGNYENLGNFPQKTAVSCIQIFQGGLWAGTEEGLARGDLSMPVLESPESWDNYTTQEGLSSNDITGLTVYRDTLYVGNSGSDYGINKLLNTSGGFEELPVIYTSGIEFLSTFEDTLYYGRNSGLYRLVDGLSERFGDTSPPALCMEIGPEYTIWAGTRSRRSGGVTRLGGLKKWIEGSWQDRAPEGALVETVNDILVDHEGHLWVSGRIEAGYENGAVCHFDGSHWVNLGRHIDENELGTTVSPDSFFSFWTRQITEDLDGSVWISSDGRGVGWFAFEGDTITGNGYYSASSGHLTNIAGTSAHYCVVRDVLTDDWGNIWICNSEADQTLSGSRPIAIVPRDFIQDPIQFPNWQYIGMKDEGGSSLPHSEFYVDRIAQDSFGYKWFGGNNNTPSSNKGIWIVDDKGTPTSETDDEWFHVLGLPSDSITSITMDRDGIVWVGTPSGVQYFYPETDPSSYDGRGIDLYGIPVGNAINIIAVDPQNNKWIGTNQGVSVLSSDNFTWLASYTNLDGLYPSPLPGNVVQAMAFDPRTGDAYLGTDKGIARLSTPYKQMGSSVTHLSLISASNPFLIGEGLTDRLYFDAAGLSETAEMKIFTAAGLLVRHLENKELIQGWDGRNLRGELVGSGIYLIMAYDPDGNADVGKVAVIHR